MANIARQVEVEAQEYLRYDWGGRAIKYHRAQIRDFLGLREATVPDADDLAHWLSEHVLPYEHRIEQLRAAILERCRALRIEPPTQGRVDRLIAAAVRAFEDRFYQGVVDRLRPETLKRLDALLVTDDSKQGKSSLHELKADPGRIGLEGVLSEIEKLRRVRGLALPGIASLHAAGRG